MTLIWEVRTCREDTHIHLDPNNSTVQLRRQAWTKTWEHDWMWREWGMASACRPSYIRLVFVWLWLPHGYQERHEAPCSLRWLKWLAWPRLSHAGRGGLSQFNLIMETLHGVTLVMMLKPVFKTPQCLGTYNQPSSLISPLPVFLPLQNNTAPLPHTLWCQVFPI